MFEFIGRVDQQVKIRGFRVELGEVESHLNRIPGVREAAVVLRTDQEGYSALVAFYSFSEEAAFFFPFLPIHGLAKVDFSYQDGNWQI